MLMLRMWDGNRSDAIRNGKYSCIRATHFTDIAAYTQRNKSNQRAPFFAGSSVCIGKFRFTRRGNRIVLCVWRKRFDDPITIRIQCIRSTMRKGVTIRMVNYAMSIVNQLYQRT